MIYQPMVEVLKPGRVGIAELTAFEISKQDAMWSSLRPRDTVSPGKYMKLHVGGTLMMSDTDMEKRSNSYAVSKATGDVLIAGLGIGLILVPILKKPDVKSVTVIEKYADVIALVKPQIESPKLSVVEADIMEWSPESGRKWDAIYFDIWPEICQDNLAQINTLHRRFAKRKKPGGWIGSWMVERLRYDAKRGF